MQYSLNYSSTRFCPLKMKITQFPTGFRLNVLTTRGLNEVVALTVDVFFFFFFPILTVDG